MSESGRGSERSRPGKKLDPEKQKTRLEGHNSQVEFLFVEPPLVIRDVSAPANYRHQICVRVRRVNGRASMHHSFRRSIVYQ